MPPKKTQEKPAVAPKAKLPTTDSTAASNDTATDAPVTSGHATKPDQDAYKREQDEIRAEIDALTVKLNTAKDKIALSNKDGPAAERRTALRAEQDQLRTSQGSNKMNRGKLLDEIKAIQENTSKRFKDLAAAKQKAPFKTVADVDDAIKGLDRQVESGNLTIAQEKRAIADISTYKRARKTIEGFAAEEEDIQKERSRADELRKELDDPEAKALSERYQQIKDELDQIKKDGDEAYAARNSLFDERNALQKQISLLVERRRQATQNYREAHDRYWKKVNEDREKRAEKYRLQRAADEEAKRSAIVEDIREQARVPAYESQIEDCQTMVDFFGKYLRGGAVAEAAVAEANRITTKSDVAGVPKLDVRKVEADPALVARKKKGEEEETYFMAGKSKAKKGSSKPQQPKEADKTGPLNLPLGILTALLGLSIPPPSSNAEIERTIDDLKTKKAWFEANQARETEVNIQKAEAKIKALEAKAIAKFGPTGEGADGDAPLAETDDVAPEGSAVPSEAGEAAPSPVAA